MSTRITWHGSDPYSGYEPGDHRTFEIQPGETVEVSDEKAEQLLADFPQLAALEGSQPAEVVGDKPMSEWSKAALDEWAAENGVDPYPSGRRAKVADKVAAIEEWQPEQGDEASVDDDEDEPEL